MKRRYIIVGLMMLFFVAMFGLSGCGLLSQAGDADLANAVGSNNGPGSGKWNPPTPKNNQQARQLVNVLEIIVDKAKEEILEFEGLYVQCVDENGKLLPGKEADQCRSPLTTSAAALQNYYIDFEMGHKAYANYYRDNGEGSNLPLPKDLIIFFPSYSPFQEMDVPGWHGCLTCTFGIAPEYVFHPVEIVLE